MNHKFKYLIKQCRVQLCAVDADGNPLDANCAETDHAPPDTKAHVTHQTVPVCKPVSNLYRL